jgi:hypothetical protein
LERLLLLWEAWEGGGSRRRLLTPRAGLTREGVEAAQHHPQRGGSPTRLDQCPHHLAGDRLSPHPRVACPAWPLPAVLLRLRHLCSFSILLRCPKGNPRRLRPALPRRLLALSLLSRWVR